ncbi:MAG: acyl-[ACP]--phospholipid O-acyltransferase [Alphaproteobacteria bacterium]|nr:acyl-[ACP]--phospholipid O-acyltransferase [Alphaproteobacteria bacterium]
MNNNQFLLLSTRRFAPLFITQFLGAFHDNVFKNAFVVMLLFDAASHVQNPKLLTTLAAGVFIFPFVIFSALGGQMADKFAKEKVIRIIKLAEILIALMGTAALFSGSVTLSFLTLFALGTHSAFFSPSKYAILPQHLEDRELIGGNALVNTGTFLAILFGTIAGTSLVTLPGGKVIVSALLTGSALSGYLSARFIPNAPAKAPGLKLNYNPFSETLDILRQSFSQPARVVRCILGIAWFWFLGATFMAQMPNYVREGLGADEHVLSLFLVLFSVGIAGGGLLNNRLLKGRIEGVYVPLAMLGITFFSFDLYLATGIPAPGPLQDLAGFLSAAHNWRIVIDILMIAVCGGLFVVPLSAIVQHLAPEDQRARILAGSAFLDALMMVLSSLASAIMIGAGFSITQLFLTFALVNALVAAYICLILPDYLMKSCLQVVFKLLYKVEVRGLENFAKAGPRAVIVGNHVSLLDPPLLAAFLPGKPMFAVNKFVAEWWWVKPFLNLVDAFPLDPTNPFSLKSLIRKVEEDRQVVIFPEGRLTDTGALMKIYDGPGMIADKTGATILPVRLDGVQHTPFARLKGKVPLKSFPRITITILEPRTFKIHPALKGRERRAAASRQLYDLMEEMMFVTGDREQTLYEALLRARYVNGDDAIILEDVDYRPLKFGKLLQGSAALGKQIETFTDKGENVGLMLPNSVGAVVAFFALQAAGRVPALMNFSSGAQAMLSACRAAQIKTIITSRRFIEMARLQETIDKISAQAGVVYLEDIRKKINKIDALWANPARLHKRQRVHYNDPAVVLFTSGSEGEPKGVVLSHANLMSNIVQLSSRVDFNRQDIVFNCMPMFHSFGLTGGTLLPVLSGIRTFLYPSPLHYRVVPEMVYAANATIMFGTDTFLQGYGKKANSYDFYRMRYIFAGAEKVKEETRKLYRDKFDVQILEGYGATETSPALTLNSSMHRKDGTVGRFLPGIEYRLETVPGIEEGGRLYVRGPNIMLGYYKTDKPGVLQPPDDGWHDTGDIVSIDEGGFVKIVGRAKRFAKIAGEMISLGMAETMAQAVWPEAQHAVIAVPDARKGEQLVLVTTKENAGRESLSAYAAKQGIPGLAVPGTIIPIAKMPVLGSGKTDYTAVKEIVSRKLAIAA